MERGRLAETEEGTPQGGVISPLLLNIALHGMEEAAGVKRYNPNRLKPDSPVLVRYADDLVVMTKSKGDAWAAKERLAKWLAPKGLSFNEEKTRVVHTSTKDSTSSDSTSAGT
jgi:RNA-directed DNA polymerase